MKIKNPVMLALDVDSDSECLRIAKLLGPDVGALKVGPRLILRFGAPLIKELAQIAPVFVDCKYLDIPSTMDAAIRASFEAGASFATVHAWAGPEALERLAKTERELAEIRPFKILVVSILTSFNQKNLPPPMSEFKIAQQVSELVEMASQKKLSGFVCSPHEVGVVRKNHPTSFLVTPGVRMAGEDQADQERVMTPSQALSEGASALVIGRSLLNAPNPKHKLKEIIDSLKESVVRT